MSASFRRWRCRCAIAGFGVGSAVFKISHGETDCESLVQACLARAKKACPQSPEEDSRLFGPGPWKILATTCETNGFLSSPAPGENLLSGNLVMETGCTCCHALLKRARTIYIYIYIYIVYIYIYTYEYIIYGDRVCWRWRRYRVYSTTLHKRQHAQHF